MEQIAEQELQLLQRRPGIAQRELRLRFTPALIEQVAKAGFSPKYGARPLQRVIERLAIPALAECLLERQRNDVLVLDWSDSGIEIRTG